MQIANTAFSNVFCSCITNNNNSYNYITLTTSYCSVTTYYKCNAHLSVVYILLLTFMSCQQIGKIKARGKKISKTSKGLASALLRFCNLVQNLCTSYAKYWTSVLPKTPVCFATAWQRLIINQPWRSIFTNFDWLSHAFPNGSSGFPNGVFNVDDVIKKNKENKSHCELG